MSRENVETTGQMKAYMKALGVDANGLLHLTFRHWVLGHSLAEAEGARKRAGAGNVNVTIGDVFSHNSLVVKALNNLRLYIAPSSSWSDIANLLAFGLSVGACVGVFGAWLALAF